MFRLMKVVATSLRSNFSRAMNGNARKVEDFNVNQDYYVWVDLELTGLDEKIHEIVEIACIITNDQLDILHEGIHYIIHQPKEVFDRGNEWTKINFPKSGLMEESLNSKISVMEADRLVAKYIKDQTNYQQNSGKYYLAGNSVYMDKRFLEKYMRNIDEILHYRLVDISSIKTLCSHWYPNIFKNLPPKELKHRALSDIKESINELKVYRDKFFIPSE